MKNYEDEIRTMIATGTKVFEIASFEWERVHGFIDYIAEELHRSWYTWSSVMGIRKVLDGRIKEVAPNLITVSQAMEFYLNAEEDLILVMEDFHPYSEASSPTNVRHLREMMRKHNYPKPQYLKTLVLSSPYKFIPDEMSKELPVIEVELPGVSDLKIVAQSVIGELKDQCLYHKLSNKLLESALGLTIMEAKLAFGKAIVIKHQLTEDEINIIIDEKEQIIKKSGLLEYYHPKEKMNSIGGLDNLKSWTQKRGNAYSEDAKKFGLNTPRGLMLLGVPGCGKSLTAKAIAKEWKFPLLRFDLGKVYGGIVGESERNIRYALDVAKTIAPCVLWIDEIEKGISGSQSSGRTDGGTSARVFGTFLTWMQEKTDPVFVVATANDISQLPPELLRKGRFDEIFFVDLPSEKERESIFKIHLQNKRRENDLREDELRSAVKESEGFSGAEIEEAINDALFSAFDEKSDRLDGVRLYQAIRGIFPLSTTMSETIQNLRAWARTRARSASAEEPASVPTHNNATILLPQEDYNPFIRRNRNERDRTE